MSKKTLKDYESEFRKEIDSQVVEVSHLNKCGVSNVALSSEVYLRKIYGDEIVVSQSSGDEKIDEKKKSVQKIGEREMNTNDEFKSVMNDIETSEFDQNLEILLKK